MPIDSGTFRDALGRFATGVTIITAVAPDGRPSGFTASSFSSVSLDPPLVLFCLDRKADVFADLDAADHFAVNILHRGHEDLSQRFAGRGPDKWRGVAYDTGPAGCPTLPGALAAMECRKARTIDGGDHVIIVGAVSTVTIGDGDGAPLVYYRGAYRPLS